MPPRCKTCSHQQRAEIDAAIIAGESLGNIAQRFDGPSAWVFTATQSILEAAEMPSWEADIGTITVMSAIIPAHEATSELTWSSGGLQNDGNSFSDARIMTPPFAAPQNTRPCFFEKYSDSRRLQARSGYTAGVFQKGLVFEPYSKTAHRLAGFNPLDLADARLRCVRLLPSQPFGKTAFCFPRLNRPNSTKDNIECLGLFAGALILAGSHIAALSFYNCEHESRCIDTI